VLHHRQVGDGVVQVVILRHARHGIDERPVGGDLTNPARVDTPARFSWLTPRNFLFTTSLKF
jgi:hypothetical protein